MKFYELNGDPVQIGSDPALRAAALAETRANCPLLEYIEFSVVYGESANPVKPSTADLTETQTRTKGEGWPDNRVSPETASVSFGIRGGKFQVDQADIRRFGRDKIPDLVLRDARKYFRKSGRALQNALMNGSRATDPNNINGIVTTFDALPAATKTARSLTLNDTIDTDIKRRNLLSRIKRALGEVAGAPKWMIMNGSVFGELDSLAGAMTNTGVDPFGAPIKTIDSVPVIQAGYNYNQAQVMPWDADHAGRIFIGFSGEEEGIAGFGNVGLALQKTIKENLVQVNAEYDIDLILLDTNSIFVIEGITYS